jgi:hypothetical protein
MKKKNLQNFHYVVVLMSFICFLLVVRVRTIPEKQNFKIIYTIWKFFSLGSFKLYVYLYRIGFMISNILPKFEENTLDLLKAIQCLKKTKTLLFYLSKSKNSKKLGVKSGKEHCFHLKNIAIISFRLYRSRL